jgi:hypothetical protein
VERKANCLLKACSAALRAACLYNFTSLLSAYTHTRTVCVFGLSPGNMLENTVIEYGFMLRSRTKWLDELCLAATEYRKG